MVQSKSQGLNFFGVFLFSLGLFSASLSEAQGYTGQSPYRLIFLVAPPKERTFDPNKDLLNLSAEDLSEEDFERKIMGAVAKGLLPMSGALGGTLALQETDFLTSLTSMSSLFSDALNDVLAKSRRTSSFEGSLYLIPFQDESRNLFYNSEKISMSPDQVTNVLMTSRNSKKFEVTVTEQIKQLQNLRSQTINPVFLLGIKSAIYLNHVKCGDLKSCLEVRALLALKPTGAAGIEFTKSNDQVAFERIVIPGSPENMATAKLKLVIPLAGRDAASVRGPWLEAEFGAFEAFVDDDFKIREQGRQNMAPGMEGKGKGIIPLTFSFSRLEFDLLSQKVQGLNVLTSMGFLTRRGRLPLGGFHIKGIDAQFEQEINNTIAGEMKALSDRAYQGAEENLKYSPLLREAFSTILGRTK